ncbi:MAG: hypothetical protein DRQ52_11100 [Gammaproteobacteria bacterium]|nr:MAG: hypothetical protein DRQ52_11100 [Gammaproteobacteria bacterium]
MSEKYVELTIEERAVTNVEHDQGCRLRAIARRLHRDPFTISRELKRNRVSGHYHPALAHQCAKQRRRNPAQKLMANPPLWELIQQLIKPNWSTQQISGRLTSCLPDKADNRVRHAYPMRHDLCPATRGTAPGDD